tara:strand:+ start:4111 stop:4917 length:807 start_codon:yes stop_codon:yes gene_type:complete
MKIFISTSNSTMHILPIFCFLFNKYWPNKEVNILGFKKPDFRLAENFNFISMSEFQENGATGWTKYLRSYFNSLEESHFVFGLDDSLIVRPVEVGIFNDLIALAYKNPEIGRIDLTPGMEWATVRRGYLKYIGGKDNYKIIECKHCNTGHLNYRLSAAMSIWNKDYFLKFMRQDRTPWEWETVGSLEAERDNRRVMGTGEAWCIRKTEGLSSSQLPGKINSYHMRQEDKDYIVNNGLIIDQQKIFGDFRHEFPEWEHVDEWETRVYGE